MPRHYSFALLPLIVSAMCIAAVPLAAQDREIGDFPKLSAERDWPWWRGPTRNGIAQSAAPTEFSETSGVMWKAPVPGRGHSSPIVVREQVFVSTADTSTQVQSIVAFDRSTGKQLWQTEVSRGGFPAKNHPKNTEASPTIACDGERLFATFFHHETIQATALDLNGKIVWQTTVGKFNPKKYEYGYAPSPLVYRNTLIISAEYDGPSYLVALKRIDGKEVWRTTRPNNITFSSPVVAPVAGREQLFLSGGDRVASFDPASGKELWSVPGTTAATCGTLIWDGDLVFASGGYPKAETLAVNAAGSAKVVWRNNQKCYEQSMITVDGYLYALTDGGVLYCWRGSDGQEMWKHRLAGPVSASPVLAGGNIYWANELGTLYVFKPNNERFELVAENHVGTDSFASPAACGGQLFLRVGQSSGGKRHEELFCFGPKE